MLTCNKLDIGREPIPTSISFSLKDFSLVLGHHEMSNQIAF